MATKKQRKRSQKAQRHEHVWIDIDEFGNETEIEAPDRNEVRSTQTSDSKAKPRSQKQSSRAPLQPSWRRAAKRSFLISALLMVFVYISNSKATGGGRIISAVGLGVLYGLLFTPLMYYLDQFAYRRWERKTAEQPRKR